MPTETMVLLAFERWDDILKSPKPDPTMLNTTAIWHFARGIAFANHGKTAEAESEQTEARETVAKISPEAMFDQLNKAVVVLKIPESLLAGAIARSRNDLTAAIDSLTQAVAAEDALNYSEPPAWYPPVRPTLGRLFLATNQATEAEKVFRADLEKNPRDGRALGGLRDSLKAQNRDYEAEQIDQQYRAAWKVAER